MEENELKTPYYETIYLDDEQTKHIAKVNDFKSVLFLEDRFTVLHYELKEI